MNAWITFWKLAYLIGLGSFFLISIYIVPAGARDLIVLFRHLGQTHEPTDMYPHQ